MAQLCFRIYITITSPIFYIEHVKYNLTWHHFADKPRVKINYNNYIFFMNFINEFFSRKKSSCEKNHTFIVISYKSYMKLVLEWL